MINTYANTKTWFKNLFFILKLHGIFSFFKSFHIKLYYTILLSQWISKHKKNSNHDFYTSTYEVNKMFDLFDFVLEKEIQTEAIDYLEFGVFKGDSIKWWVNNVKNTDSIFVGFDTFTGLPEDFGAIKKGGYSAENNLPQLNDPRCKFVQGLYQETLFNFLQSYKSKNRKVIHIDCDLYSSTLCVLSQLAPYLKFGDIIIFDEFITPTQEFKAWIDVSESFYLKYKVIAGRNNFHQVAIKMMN